MEIEIEFLVIVFNNFSFERNKNRNEKTLKDCFCLIRTTRESRCLISLFP